MHPRHLPRQTVPRGLTPTHSPSYNTNTRAHTAHVQHVHCKHSLIYIFYYHHPPPPPPPRAPLSSKRLCGVGGLPWPTSVLDSICILRAKKPPGLPGSQLLDAIN